MSEVRQELLTASEVRIILGMEKSTFYDFLKKAPEFPKPRKIGQIGKWVREEVEWYIRHAPISDEQPERPKPSRSSGQDDDGED